ncbi:MAG: hypothetical protein JOZ24_04925, partial [Candidatus Eremiobacteraeota bacterium]|nr:hypothetical protein [Candidatus Eremiobacteraeota bacterium]
MTDSVRSALQRTLVLLLFVSFVIGASSAALAQATTGVISGTITGPGSKPVNGAKIRAVAP